VRLSRLGLERLVTRMRRGSFAMMLLSVHFTTSSNRRVGITELWNFKYESAVMTYSITSIRNFMNILSGIFHLLNAYRWISAVKRLYKVGLGQERMG
jgi:hypothetical protein